MTGHSMPRKHDLPPLKLVIVVFLASLLVSGVIIFTVLYSVLEKPATPVIDAVIADGVREIIPPRELMDFALPSQTGQSLSLGSLRGSPVLLYFGYTHCPDVCLITLAEMMRARELLGERGEQVAFLFISVDGKRDTPEILQRYFSQRGLEQIMLGMSGDEVTLRRIAPDYGLYYELLPDDDGDGYYSVDHTANLYLIDAQGRLSNIFAYGTAPEVIAEYVGKLF